MKRRYAVVGLALVLAFSTISPALGGPSPVGTVAGTVKDIAQKALGKSKKASKRARKARRLARQNAELIAELARLPGPEGPKGDAGPRGEEGPPGPSTGPAGGDLTGNYPNPSIAPGAVGAPELEGEAVTGVAVAPNSLGGVQINESSLVGVDKSGLGGSFSHGPGGSSSSNAGGGFTLGQRCTGSVGNIGAEVFVRNESGFSRIVYAYAFTDGGTAQVERVSIANGATATVIDIGESTTSDAAHWVTVLFTQGIYRRYEYLIRTKAFGLDRCDGNGFRTLTSG